MAGDGKMAMYKDVIELKSDYHQVLTHTCCAMAGPGGSS